MRIGCDGDELAHGVSRGSGSGGRRWSLRATAGATHTGPAVASWPPSRDGVLSGTAVVGSARP
ncbi:hypothetical protein DVS28_a3714 [Euzebya pacifica]|uniref:Uncharacterized protein n=1 Tax=Euzebya pacifica TaxID=1608957 RepID=A0A346Y1P0_9ACTN|nr:hypothetical protein DVS28_a3714 [Euzebya pacifica]